MRIAVIIHPQPKRRCHSKSRRLSRRVRNLLFEAIAHTTPACEAVHLILINHQVPLDTMACDDIAWCDTLWVRDDTAFQVF
jgi:hypothetical protein